MTGERNRVNVYTCTACGHRTTTVDRDEGVTPFMIGCPECDTWAHSAFYQVDQTLAPEFEWYRPTADELDAEISEAVQQVTEKFGDAHAAEVREGLEAAIREHAEKGGLSMRPVDADRSSTS